MDPNQTPITNPQNGQQPQFAPYAASPNPTPRRSKTRLIVAAIVLFMVIALVITAVLITKKPSAKNASSNSSAQSAQQASQLSLLKQYGTHLKANDLSKFDKTALFYAVFKNAAMQREVSALTDDYEGATSTDQTTRKLEYITQAYYDYASKKGAFYQSDPAGDYSTQCIGSHAYRYSDVYGWVPDSSDTTCSDSLIYAQHINDGVNTGGLNAQQAQTFISTIENATGLVTVHDMSYITHDGMPYIRLVVTVDPVATSTGHQAMGVILGAFDKTGLNAETWPYENNGGNADGIKMIYYISPATQLPAYSQITQTYYIDDTTGNHTPVPAPYTPKDTEYTFGGVVPDKMIPDLPHALKLSWSEEKM